MDYRQALGAEFREVQDLRHNGKPARAVIASRLYRTDIGDLWDALTNADRIPRWFSPVSGTLEAGGRYQIEGNAGGDITRCDPPAALDITWEYGGSVSWVNVRLVPADNATRLTLTHIMPKDDVAEKHWAEYGPGATGVGWDLSFLGLGLHLGHGGDVDPDENATWMASDAGKAFLRLCADAWAAAHISAGESPELAQAMGARTGAAYSGE